MQQSKYEALELLPQLRSSANDESLQPKQQLSTMDFELTHSGRDTIDAAPFDEYRQRDGEHFRQSQQQQCASLDESGPQRASTKPMLSPLATNHRDGFQYPNHRSGYSNTSNERDYRRMQTMQSSTPKLFTRAIGEAHNRLYEHELGEAPMSMQPTDFEQTNDSHSQMMFTSNPDLAATLLRQEEGTDGSQKHEADNRAAQHLNPSPRLTEDASGIDATNRADEYDRSGLGPMRLEFLQQEPLRDRSLTEADAEQRALEGAATGVAENAEEASPANQLAADMVRGVLQSSSTKVEPGSKASTKPGSKLDIWQPIQSVFSSSGMIAKANQVRQEVNDRMAKIKAMQEDFLRKPRESKSKSSVRSGRQMSDQDFDKLSKELGQTIRLRNLAASDVHSEQDQATSDLGDAAMLQESNPATVEYFVGPELSGQR